jgi:hypothetical protein
MSMSKFEDHLWREFVREHGDDLANLTTRAPSHAVPRRLIAAGGGLAVAACATALALVLTSTSAPAFAVTRNHNGTVTVTIRSTDGIAGANAALHQLGIRAQVMTKAPAGCTNTVVHAAPATLATGTANGQWTINPPSNTAIHSLVLTPPRAGDRGPKGKIGSGGGSQIWVCRNLVVPSRS